MFEFFQYLVIGIVALLVFSPRRRDLINMPLNVLLMILAIWPAVVILNVAKLAFTAKDWVAAAAAVAWDYGKTVLQRRGWISLVALALVTAPAAAQQPTADPSNPPLHIFADTAGVAHVYDEVYVTWIQARAAENSWPSAAVLVAFDCEAKKVKRLAQVKYELLSDSSGVKGPIQEVSLPWMDPTNPRLFNLVCAIGQTRPRAGTGKKEIEHEQSPWYPKS